MIAALLGHWFAAIVRGRVGRDCHIKFNWIAFDRELKARRHHADNGVNFAIQLERAAEHIGISPEVLSPEIVAENYFESARSAASLLVRPRECPANCRLDAENVENFRA